MNKMKGDGMEKIAEGIIELDKLHYISKNTMFKSSIIFEKLLVHIDKCNECQKLWDNIIYHYENSWQEHIILSLDDIKKKIGGYLKTLNIDNFRVNFAKQEKFGNKDIWKVGIEFFEKIGEAEYKSAAIMIDTNGEMMQFEKGCSWLF